MNDSPATAAQNLKALLIRISPLIEEYTASTCPGCTDVCCKQKRAFLDREDILYITALGLPLPDYDPARDPESRCQFMGITGCMSPRWLRPWRCTWYFCTPLLAAIDNGPQKKARTLSALIRQILELRGRLS